MTLKALKIAKLGLVAGALFSMFGCAAKINGFTVKTVLDRATDRPDIGRVCAVGDALGIPLMSLTKEKNFPKKALIVAEVSAAMCAEIEGREHALEGELLNVFPGGGRKGGTIVNEGLARWTHEGETGYGIAEYLHQFDDEGNPIVPIE